jgi:hypothetical protein
MRVCTSTLCGTYNSWLDVDMASRLFWAFNFRPSTDLDVDLQDTFTAVQHV